MTNDGSQSFTYDAASRLKTASWNTSSYEYDGDGNRVKQANSSGTVYYLWSSVLGEPVVELTSGGVYRAYVYGPGDGQMIAMQSYDGAFYWLHTDHLGSGRKITNSSGTVVYRGEFDPHGQALYEWHSTGQTYLNSHKFTGYERDWATNLNYAKARTYHHNRGRFMQPDPLGLGAAVLSDPQSLNRYSYVGNDPANFTDPLGLACFARYLVTTTYSDGQVIGETWQFIGIFCDDSGGGYYELLIPGGGGQSGGDPAGGYAYLNDGKTLMNSVSDALKALEKITGCASFLKGGRGDSKDNPLALLRGLRDSNMIVVDRSYTRGVAHTEYDTGLKGAPIEVGAQFFEQPKKRTYNSFNSSGPAAYSITMTSRQFRTCRQPARSVEI